VTPPRLPDPPPVAAADDPLPAAPARPVGRPRRLTLEAVLDAAEEIGLADVTMRRLAQHLGVGLATLYRYVSDRDALVRLLTGRAGYRKPPPDRGQPWPVLVTGYARSIHSSLVSQPALLDAYLRGTLTAALEIEFADDFLAALGRRGFTPMQALALYHDMSMIVIGAAVVEAHVAALQSRGETIAQHVLGALTQRERGELASVRAVQRAYADPGTRSHWQRALQRLLAGVAAQRGEAPAAHP
jgi:AcrR family transcriptional regulator